MTTNSTKSQPGYIIFPQKQITGDLISVFSAKKGEQKNRRR